MPLNWYFGILNETQVTHTIYILMFVGHLILGWSSAPIRSSLLFG